MYGDRERKNNNQKENGKWKNVCGGKRKRRRRREKNVKNQTYNKVKIYCSEKCFR